MTQPHPVYQDLIQRRIDGTLDQQELFRLEQHLQVCEVCSVYARELTNLEGWLSRDLSVSVPERLLDAGEMRHKALDILRKDRKEQMNKRISTFSRNLWMAGVAILLLAVIAWAISRIRPQNTLPAADSTLTAITSTTPLPITSPTNLPTTGVSQRFTADEAGLSFEIPLGWEPVDSDGLRYEGVDGFFAFQEITSVAASLIQACEWVGNDPKAYGSAPRFEWIVIGDRTACSIFTSLNRSEDNRNSVVFADDDAANPQRFFRLDVWDPQRFNEIMASMQFVRPATAQVASKGAPTAIIDQPPAGEITPIVQEAAGLTIEAYPVVEETVDTPTHFEFNQRIPSSVFEKRQTWRGNDPALQLDNANRLLQPFDYELVEPSQEGSQQYDLIHAGQPILQGIVTIRPVSVYPSGEDFLLQIETQDGQAHLVQKSGIQEWDPAQHYYIPATLVGDRLASLQPVGDNNTVGVWVGEDLVFTYHVVGIGPSNPVKGLVSYGDHWALEIDGMVFVDGKRLNDEIDAREVFGFHLLQGKPFYFFAQNDQYYASNDGEILPIAYDQIIHDQCCEPAAFNLGYNGDMVWFYALSGHTWNYVEIGAYPE